jgi:motility quorum-sensing regulator / GCU-specific mRNA interferase toxin
MEKFTPHCDLSTVKAMIQAGKVHIAMSALAGADALRLDAKDIVSIVMELTLKDFYKSMTSHNNHREWQDVYRPITHVGAVYLKLIVANEVLVLSFKEL